MELKETDKKLLLSLFQNSKKSNRELSKELKISNETISSKINSYFNEGLIKSYQLRVNYEKLGFKEFNLFIRFKKISIKIIDDFIKYLIKHTKTTWIGKSFGKYDLKVAFIIEDITQINSIVLEISSKFGKEIESLDSLYIVDKYKNNSSMFLTNLFELEKNIQFKNNKFPIKNIDNKKREISITTIDKKLIYLIGQNPKISYVELALKLGFTAEGVKAKIKKLERDGVILGNGIVLNGNKLNKIWCLVLLNINSERITDLKKYLQNKSFTTSYVETLGIYNFNLTFFGSNISIIYENLNQIRSDFSEDIRNLDFLIFFDFYKYPQIPKCIMD